MAISDDRFSALVRTELDRAYRLAGLLLGNAAEAEDATQDALLRAWQAWESLRDPAAVRPWFDRILVNVCRFIPLEDATSRHAGDPFRELLAGDATTRALDTLDPDLRTVIILRFGADLTVDDIARRLDWPAGTVKSRLHRALVQLRSELKGLESSEVAT
jgi:RNA polymerase sigma-70 factor, ECF subfamily